MALRKGFDPFFEFFEILLDKDRSAKSTDTDSGHSVVLYFQLVQSFHCPDLVTSFGTAAP